MKAGLQYVQVALQLYLALCTQFWIRTYVNEAVSEAFDTAYPFGRGEGWGPFDATGAAGEVDD